MAVSFGVLDYISGGVIAALILLNVSVGAWTEWEAEKIVANLASVGAPTAVVLRHAAGSREVVTPTISVDEVVPGDIVLLKNGDIVPADGRVLDGVSNLEADEAFLTGESLPVAKQSEPVDQDDCPVGDRLSMVFSGAMITKGRGTVVVTGTGMSTEIGKIAKALQSKGERTETGWAARWHWVKVKLGLAETSPLQYKLNSLAFCLLGAAILTAIVVLATTGFRNIPKSMATYTVAAAVSMLPVSMVAVVSLTLAQASGQLAKTNVLVRRMDAIEALAGVDNVCSDKTGTLTVGRMVVRKMWVPANDTKVGETYRFETGSDPFYPRGQVSLESKEAADGDEDNAIRTDAVPRDLHHLVMCTALCNQATLSRPQEDDDGWQANGDPTEVALQVASYKLGYGKPYLVGSHAHAHKGWDDDDLDGPAVDAHYEQVIEHPFDSSVKRMSIAYKHVGSKDQGYLCLLKGALERILACCVAVGDKKLTDAETSDIMAMVDHLAGQGLRVLGFASKMTTDDVQSLSRE